ncbi:MAG: ATP-binding protein, partial [Lachnospiraceae bacterium]|nr:ATP-binding protein [Lachnospiraceae bacterium]
MGKNRSLKYIYFFLLCIILLTAGRISANAEENGAAGSITESSTESGAANSITESSTESGAANSITGSSTENAAADTTEKVLRVAYYPLKGFFEYDAQGNEVGYGVELLKKISQYTGIQFQYIPADSWEKTKQMLLEGEADLRMPATVPVSPSTTLSYNATSVLDTYNALLTKDTRDDLYYQDFDTIRTLKIAISENFYEVNAVQKYLDMIGVTKEQLILCSEFNECRDKLAAGEADALISNIMDMDSSMKMLSRFGNTSNYISMVLGNPVLEILDEALAEIKLDEPLFLSDLYEDWFPERTTIPLTLEESEYLASVDTLTFAFWPDEGYLSNMENGIYRGIYIELAKCICEKLGVEYRAVSIPDCLEGTETTDIYAGFFYDQNYADEWNYSLSAPMNDINYYMIQKKETTVDLTNCIIAANKKFHYTSEYLEKQYTGAQFLLFDTYEECLQAVEAGSADMTVINNYIAEYYLGMYQFSDLSAKLSTEYSNLFCFAAEDHNDILASILTKAASMITEEEMNQLYIRGQEQRPESNYLLAVIYRSPVQVSLAVAGIFALIVALIMLLVFARKSKKKNRELATALSAKSSFLARMSHDMRTPMNGILGLSYLMEDQKDPGVVKEYIFQLRETGKYLLQLINDVLDVSKIECGKFTLHPRVCNEEKLFNSIIVMMEPMMKAKNIDFHFEKIDIEWQYMRLDEQRVKQIFVNLISNAIKFTPNGGRIDFVMELVSQTQDVIRDKFIVRDTGIGMSQEFLPHIYDAFCQEGRSDMDKGNGTGLGLSIVKQLVELMEGSITVKSEIDKGTEVTVYLNFPLAERPEEEVGTENEEITFL